MVERKTMRLQDLFKTGHEVKFDLEHEGEPVEIIIWMRKPTAGQQDEALAKARGKQARRKRAFKDQEGDAYVAVWSDVESFENVEELKDQLVRFEGQRLRSQAFNEVLHDENFIPKDEDGEPLWDDENSGYLDLLTGIQSRMEEISTFNASLEDGEDKLFKTPEEDEELIELQKEREVFEQFVTDRFEALTAEHMKAYDGKRMTQLKNELIKKLIDADTSLVWYEQYRTWMLYFACRDPEDKTKPYFSEQSALMDIPTAVLTYLEGQLDDMENTGDTLKNLPSLQLS